MKAISVLKKWKHEKKLEENVAVQNRRVWKRKMKTWDFLEMLRKIHTLNIWYSKEKEEVINILMS